MTGYEGTDNNIDQLRAFRTDLFLGAPEIVRNNLRFNGIEISEIDTLGLLEAWKQHFAQVSKVIHSSRRLFRCSLLHIDSKISVSKSLI